MNTDDHAFPPLSIEENDSSRLVLLSEEEPQLRTKEEEDNSKEGNRKGFVARTNITQDFESTDQKRLEAICRELDAPMSSRFSEDLTPQAGDFPPPYDRAISDNSTTYPKKLPLRYNSSQSDVKRPISDSSDSSSDSDNDDEINALDLQKLLKEIEFIRKQQEEMKQLQESHDKRLKELLEREPCVHRRLETIRQSTKHAQRKITTHGIMFEKKGGMVFTQESIYVQLEQLYENLHRLNFPTKTIQSVLGNDYCNSYYDANTLNEIESLKKENSMLKKKVLVLENSLREKPSFLPRRFPQRRNSPPPPCRTMKRPALGQIQAKSETNLIDVGTTSPGERFVAGRPSTPQPILMTPREIRPVEVTFKWTISDYSKKLNLEIVNGSKECSSPFYLSHCGYRGQMEAYLNGNGTAKNKCISVFLRIIKGDYDRYLKWPVNLHFVVILVNQSGNQQDSLKADGNQFQYQKPCGVSETESDCWGLIEFVSHPMIQQRRYIKDDNIVLKCRIIILPI